MRTPVGNMVAVEKVTKDDLKSSFESTMNIMIKNIDESLPIETYAIVSDGFNDLKCEFTASATADQTNYYKIDKNKEEHDGSFYTSGTSPFYMTDI